MKKVKYIIFLLLVSFASITNAETKNPIDMIISGGYTLNVGVSETTQLYVDKNAGAAQRFWVRVIDDEGVPPSLDEVSSMGTATVYTKYFHLKRWKEVNRAARKIQTFGIVNPYVDGNVICDAPNTTIRRGNQSVFMAYNCGSDSPDADAATFATEDLLKALRTETKNDPDLVQADF